jgi:hypothetical protein
MARVIIRSTRSFQVWSYSVSHCELLIRSVKSAEWPTRVDIIFKGVEAVHLPTLATQLSITETSDADIRKPPTLRQGSLGKDMKVFLVEGADFVGYVAALIALVHEDDGEYYDPSFFTTKLPPIGEKLSN